MSLTVPERWTRAAEPSAITRLVGVAKQSERWRNVSSEGRLFGA